MYNQTSNPSLSPFGQGGLAANAPRWRYKTLILEAKHMREDKYNDPLNQLGNEGWEMVSATPGTVTISQMIYTFKKLID